MSSNRFRNVALAELLAGSCRRLLARPGATEAATNFFSMFTRFLRFALFSVWLAITAIPIPTPMNSSSSTTSSDHQYPTQNTALPQHKLISNAPNTVAIKPGPAPELNAINVTAMNVSASGYINNGNQTGKHG